LERRREVRASVLAVRCGMWLIMEKERGLYI